MRVRWCVIMLTVKIRFEVNPRERELYANKWQCVIFAFSNTLNSQHKLSLFIFLVLGTPKAQCLDRGGLWCLPLMKLTGSKNL